MARRVGISVTKVPVIITTPTTTAQIASGCICNSVALNDQVTYILPK